MFAMQGTGCRRCPRTQDPAAVTTPKRRVQHRHVEPILGALTATATNFFEPVPMDGALLCAQALMHHAVIAL